MPAKLNSQKIPQFLSLYYATFSGGDTVNELDQGDIHSEPGDKKWMKDMSLYFLFPLEWVIKKLVAQCARKTLQRHLMNHLMQPLRCLIELIRGLIELSDDGFWGCRVLDELKVGLRKYARVGMSSWDTYTHSQTGVQ